MVVFSCQTGVRVSIYVDVFIEIQYRFKRKLCFQSMCIALMLRNVYSQTNVKIDINYVIDIQNMQEHNNNKELDIFVFASDIFVNQGVSQSMSLFETILHDQVNIFENINFLDHRLPPLPLQTLFIHFGLSNFVC